MNLALWLERAGMSHGPRPAVGLGDRVVRDYADLAGRVARLAGALRQRFGLQPGDRVAIAAHNSIDYLDVLYAIWHAGLAAVPANAKLHGAELGYILEHSQARVCFASSDLEAAIAAHAPPTLGASRHHRQRRLRRIVPGRCDRDHAAAAGRSRLAVLHLGHHRPAQGCDADAPRALLGEPRLCRRGRPDRPRRCDPARRADEPWLRALHHGAYCAAGDQRGAGLRRLRSGGDLPALHALATGIDVRRADDGPAPARLRRRLRSRAHPHADLGRRAHVCRGHARGAAALRTAPRANLRPGRKSDDDLHAVEAGHRRPRASALAGAVGVGGPPVCLRRGDDRGRAGPAGGRRARAAKSCAGATS